MKLKTVIMVATCAGFLNASCAGSFELARVAGIKERSNPKGEVKRDEARCRDLDDSATTWQAVALGAGALGAAQGGGLMAIPDVSKDVRVGLAVGTVVASAVAVAAGAISKSKANAWAKECAGP